MSDADADRTGAGAARISREAIERPKPKRFYTTANVTDGENGSFAVVLDGRPVRTPRRAALAVPSRPLAVAIAAEWQAQGEFIDPVTMPLTKTANTAIDGVMGRESEVHEDIVRYIGNDLLLYRADAPRELVARQLAAWDPVLGWVAETFSAELRTTTGVMPIEQNVVEVAKVASALSEETALSLAPLHIMTTLTGSALLTIAYRNGRLTADEVWTATHVDEDWQISQWGEDVEAAERREKRWQEMQAAARFLELLPT